MISRFYCTHYFSLGFDLVSRKDSKLGVFGVVFVERHLEKVKLVSCTL